MDEKLRLRCKKCHNVEDDMKAKFCSKCGTMFSAKTVEKIFINDEGLVAMHTTDSKGQIKKIESREGERAEEGEKIIEIGPNQEDLGKIL